MPKVVEESPRAKRAASNMLDTPHLGIPYHMRGSKYTMEEADDRTMQAGVRNLWKELEAKKQTRNPSSAAAMPTIEAAPPESAPPAAAAAAADPTPLRPRVLMEELTSQQSAKPKKTRKTSLAVQQERVNALARKTVEKEARKMATRLWAMQSEKKKRGDNDFMSIEQVRERVVAEYGTAPCIATIYNDLKEGRVGQSPKKRPGNSKISDSDWVNVCAAFVSLVQINQLNRDDGKNNQKDLGAKIAAVFGNRHSAQHLIE
ncbi:hypothetical protein ACHAWO_002194, partial [Cyclotella atomus]